MDVTIGTYLKGTPAQADLSISQPDWARHLYIISTTGGGKSQLIKYLTSQLDAFCLIDKEGDLAREVADSRDCIYIRPADFQHPVGLNPFRRTPPDMRDETAGMFKAMLSDIWDLGEHTPLLNDHLYAATRLALEVSYSSPVDLPRVLMDPALRARFLKKCHDRETREFWEHFNGLDKKSQLQAASSTLNKVRAFSRLLPVRLMMGQTSSTIDIRKIMDTGKTVVLDLYGIAPEAQKIIGAIFQFQFYIAAMGRDGTERKPYTLFIDEFAHFATGTVPHILAESRKRGLSLCIAHQNASQLERGTLESIIGNCGNRIVLDVGAIDAPILSQVLRTSQDAIIGQKPGHGWASVLHKGKRVQSVPIDIPMVQLPTGHLAANIATTRARYSRTREDVEYQLNWYERVKFARKVYEEKRKAEEEAKKKEEAEKLDDKPSEEGW
ncbi:type IV secretory system conjugative DNA transfer family protein [Rhodopseudomonas palustris]|uniref:type IV secretory system conjugative DNA transfer family protein n=1 Tax=Rhodopseudomonas palustris TaxID=1076 RepID=UPI000D1B40D8|nr:TraM recognition domain-containing protein [Rhodopseudomonas palustris]AVT83652.1 hypothetical protein RPYSC3_47920 [Rhodopseudomonas palustris]